MVIDEGALGEFRRAHLSPSALLELILEHVWVLVRLGIGVGKSAAIDALLSMPALYERFDLVIYAAPTWDILHERRIVAGLDRCPVPWMQIEPRPVEKCGRYADRWSELEKQSCTALAKATLCRECQASPDQPRCDWPARFKERKGTQLIFTTEQQFRLNRALILFLKHITGANRVLVISDEARFIDGNFARELDPRQIQRFREVLAELARRSDKHGRRAAPWIGALDALLTCPPTEIAGLELKLHRSLLRSAYVVQECGVNRFGRHFRFLAYDLLQFVYSRREERTKFPSGLVRFTARPYLDTHVLIASAHLEAEYVAHRLGEHTIPSPFDGTSVRHSGTRIVNLRSRLGADQYFAGNKKQILDTFAVVLFNSILHGRSTLFVSRLKTKEMCAQYLAERLRGWGVEVRFVLTPEGLPARPDPRVVPIIHYGVLGTNDYREYESAYCLNGYYVSSSVLNDAVQEFDPEHFRAELRIASGPHLLRRVELVDRAEPDLDRTWLGNLYLRRLEIDPVVQAVGRVRFLTMPREVVCFQMADLHSALGPHTEVRSLEGLRQALDLPLAKDLDRAISGARIHAKLGLGLSANEIAGSLGISRATLFRLSKAWGSLKTPYKNSIRGIETPGEFERGAGA